MKLVQSLIGSQKSIQLKLSDTHCEYKITSEKYAEFKNAFKIVNIRNPYSQAVSQMFKNLWSDSGSSGLKFENGVFTTKSMNTPFKLEHAIETFWLITRACYVLKANDQLDLGHLEQKELLESYVEQASCKPVKDCLERLNWIHTYQMNALGDRSWQVYTLNDKPMMDHYMVFHKQRQSWKGLLDKLFDKSTADELFNNVTLHNHFVRSENYISKYNHVDFYTPKIKKMVYCLRQPEIDYHKWKFDNN